VNFSPGVPEREWRSWLRHCPMVSLEFFIDIILSVALWHCGRLSL
jgi:hypothetical protein